MVQPIEDRRIHVNDDTGDTTNFPVKGDATSQSMRVACLVWDSDTTAWVRMTQPSIIIDSDDFTVNMGDVEKLLACDYWNDARFDWTSGDLDYKGLNITHKAATDSATWYIWKYTWSNSLPVRIEGPLVGSWDNRAILAWA